MEADKRHDSCGFLVVQFAMFLLGLAFLGGAGFIVVMAAKRILS
jgi:nitrate reductase NapE component